VVNSNASRLQANIIGGINVKSGGENIGDGAENVTPRKTAASATRRCACNSIKRVACAMSHRRTAYDAQS